MNSRSKCTVRCRTVYGLAIRFGLFGPLSCYRVYDVKDAKFVGSGSFLEVGIQFLNKYRFGLEVNMLAGSNIMNS